MNKSHWWWCDDWFDVMLFPLIHTEDRNTSTTTSSAAVKTSASATSPSQTNAGMRTTKGAVCDVMSSQSVIPTVSSCSSTHWYSPSSSSSLSSSSSPTVLRDAGWKDEVTVVRKVFRSFTKVQIYYKWSVISCYLKYYTVKTQHLNLKLFLKSKYVSRIRTCWDTTTTCRRRRANVHVFKKRFGIVVWCLKMLHQSKVSWWRVSRHVDGSSTLSSVLPLSI